MDIIIVGCGKVGYTLVELLSSEDHNLVVIDEKPERVSRITDSLDAMGIVGNGIDHKTLLDAGIETADLLIAVTGDDEKNLLCCVIAKKSGRCQTIARVRNPIYNEESESIEEVCNILKEIITPEDMSLLTYIDERMEYVANKADFDLEMNATDMYKELVMIIEIIESLDEMIVTDPEILDKINKPVLDNKDLEDIIIPN